MLLLVGQAGMLQAAGLETSVYFSDKQGVMVQELRNLAEGENPLLAVGKELLRGPANTELYTSIPDKTAIRRVWTDKDVVYIDFTKELFSYGGGTSREQVILAQIILTFTQSFGAHSVQILIEGEPRLAPEGSPTDQPLSRDDILMSLQGRGGK